MNDAYLLVGRRLVNGGEASANGLEGRPARLVASADLDRDAFDQASAGAGKLGRTQCDAWFVLAVEYAAESATDRALYALRQAVDQGSLYLPWALPHGPTEFPAALSRTPAYAAIRKSSPGLVDLMAGRSTARATAETNRRR